MEKDAHPYLGHYILHKPCVQLKRPLTAPTLHVGRVIVGAITSIWRSAVFRHVQMRGITHGVVSQVGQRLHTCVVGLREEEIIWVLAESNE